MPILAKFEFVNWQKMPKFAQFYTWIVVKYANIVKIDQFFHLKIGKKSSKNWPILPVSVEFDKFCKYWQNFPIWQRNFTREHIFIFIFKKCLHLHLLHHTFQLCKIFHQSKITKNQKIKLCKSLTNCWLINNNPWKNKHSIN